MTYKVLVTGSRSWTDTETIAAELDTRLAALPTGATLTVIVGYDPKRRYPPGADQIAYEYCETTAEFAEYQGKTLAVETFPADWQAPCRPDCDHGPRPRNRRGQEYCPAAGDYRNADMVARVAAELAERWIEAECLAFVAPCVKPRCRKPKPHGSHGAEHCANLAERAGIETRRLRPVTRIRVERPDPYVVRRGRCGAPASPDRGDVRCGEPAKFFPCGWRCDPHRPRPDAVRPTGGAA